MKTFILSPALAEEIFAHARGGWPEEVCGIIAGRGGVGLRLHRGRNVAAHPRTEYLLDEGTLSRQIEFADEGLELAAIYHSHPAGPAVPSPVDVARAFYPQAVYIICGLGERGAETLRGFRIEDGRVEEVELRIEDAG